MRAHLAGCLLTLLVVSGCSGGSDAGPDGPDGPDGGATSPVDPSASTEPTDEPTDAAPSDATQSPAEPAVATGPPASITGLTFNLPEGWEVDEKTSSSLLVASPAGAALSVRGLSAFVVGTQGRPLDTDEAYDLQVAPGTLRQVRRLPDETYDDQQWFHLEGALGPATDVVTYGSAEGQEFGVIQLEFGSEVPRSEQRATARSVLRTVLLD